ncbi:PAS domain-containing protein, partial [Acinetobacter baumannii]
WEQDLATGTGYFTEEFCRMLGETAETMVPTCKAFADRLDPDERRRLIAASQSAFAGDPNTTFELRFRRRDGTLRHL